ncbi:MAG: OmpH family outer membrane protein [Rhodocyclaceae bacterium]|nr:OmpH family outer membrane protein [Rhodocyclaceae bacterium]
MLVVVFTALAVLAGGSAFAEGKVGVINIERVMRDSEPAKRAMKKLEKEFEKRGQDLEKLRQQAQKMQEELEKNGATLAESQRKARERELADLSRDFQRKQRELNEDLNARRNEELQGVVDRTNKAIRAIAEKEGYDLVLQEAAYFNPHIDITEKVIKALAEPVAAK